jgi:predicted acyltransferase
MATTDLSIHSAEYSRNPATGSPGRLLCLDIYRGLMVAGMIIVDNPGSDEHAYWPIMHAKWNGWTPADFIFPSFLFPRWHFARPFDCRSKTWRSIQPSDSVACIQTKPDPHRHRTSCKRFTSLRSGSAHMAIRGCHPADRNLLPLCTDAGIVGWTARPSARVRRMSHRLLGYRASFVPVPGAGIPVRDIPFLDQVQNLPAWLDRKLFAGHLYDGTSDPEGILHTIPAIATTIIGVLTGHWLKSNRTAAQLIGGMSFFGILGVLGGELWNGWFPINKHMWTSSFVLFSGGFCLLFLSLLYWATEVRRWRGRWTMPILVFGMNAIAGFVADSLIYGPGYTFTVTTESGTKMNWHEAAQAHLEVVGLSVANASLVYSLGALLICWIMLWFLWRKKVFLKI